MTQGQKELLNAWDQAAYAYRALQNKNVSLYMYNILWSAYNNNTKILKAHGLLPPGLIASGG